MDRGGCSLRMRPVSDGARRGVAVRRGTSGKRSSSSTRPARRSSDWVRRSTSAARREPPGTPSRPRGRGWRGCSCSPTSSSPRTWQRSSGTRPGGIWSGGTTTCSPRWLSARAARSCGPRATGSSSPSKIPSPRSRVRWPSNRTLEEHRREQGFSPKVRIGLHRAEATKEGTDWSGKGVHAAARIGALAEGDEILVSSATAEAAGGSVAVSDPRTVSLKGLFEPVEVVAVQWR